MPQHTVPVSSLFSVLDIAASSRNVLAKDHAFMILLAYAADGGSAL
jgi:hypothetical protein